MRIVGTSSNGRTQEISYYSNINRGIGRGSKISFQSRFKSSHGGHHKHESQPHGGGGNFRRRGSCEVVLEVIKVNN